jgi:hypothetical protein
MTSYKNFNTYLKNIQDSNAFEKKLNNATKNEKNLHLDMFSGDSYSCSAYLYNITMKFLWNPYYYSEEDECRRTEVI